jgi:hypothetical protein
MQTPVASLPVFASLSSIQEKSNHHPETASLWRPTEQPEPASITVTLGSCRIEINNSAAAVLIEQVIKAVHQL